MVREPRWRLAVRLLVALLCAAALLQAARPGVYSARTGAAMVRDGDPAGEQFREQLEYIADELRRQVPPGARVVVDSADDNWKLRITELATVRGIVVVGAGGDLVVRVEFDPAAPHGVRVVTAKAAGA